MTLAHLDDLVSIYAILYAKYISVACSTLYRWHHKRRYCWFWKCCLSVHFHCSQINGWHIYFMWMFLLKLFRIRSKLGRTHRRGFALYHPEMVANKSRTKFKLAPYFSVTSRSHQFMLSTFTILLSAIVCAANVVKKSLNLIY